MTCPAEYVLQQATLKAGPVGPAFAFLGANTGIHLMSTEQKHSITQYRQRSSEKRRLYLTVGVLMIAAGVGLHYTPGTGTLAYSIFLCAGGALALWLMPDGFGRPLKEKVYLDWCALPTLEEYWARHPDTKTSSGPSCHKCRSKSLQNWGLLTKHDGDRIVSCRACGTTLYRI